MTDERKNYWDVIIAVITLIGAILAGGLTFQQYLEAKTKDRVEQTVQFLTRFDSAPLSDSRQRLDKLWSDLRDSLPDSLAPTTHSLDLFEMGFVGKVKGNRG